MVFWDFDGTLALREGMWSGALEAAVRAVSPECAVTADELRPHLQSGFPWHEPSKTREPLSRKKWWEQLQPVMLRALAETGISRDVAEATTALMPTEYYRPDAWQLIDGASAALSTTKKAGIRNYILSNHAPELPRLVQLLGLSSLVVDTITSASVGAEKPNRRIFEIALVRAQVAADRAFMVGDSVSADIDGARIVGMRSILANGVHGVSLREAARRIVALPTRNADLHAWATQSINAARATATA